MQVFIDWFEKTRSTPPAKRSRELFAHQIFFSETLDGLRRLCDPSERAALDAEGARRWDFFNRPDRHALEALDAERIRELQHRERHRGRMKLLCGLAFVAALGAAGYLAFTGMVAQPVAIGIGAVAGLIIGGVFFWLIARDEDPGDMLKRAQEFQRELEKGMSEIEAGRATREEMTAALDAAIRAEMEETRRDCGAAGDVISAHGPASANALTEDSAAIYGQIAPLGRLVSRRGGVFAACEIASAAVAGDRLYLRRALYDAVTGERHLLEQRDMRRDAVEIGVKISRGAIQPGAEGAVDGESMSPPAAKLTWRTLQIGTPAGERPTPLTDATLLDALKTVDEGRLKALEKQIAAAQKTTSKAFLALASKRGSAPAAEAVEAASEPPREKGPRAAARAAYYRTDPATLTADLAELKTTLAERGVQQPFAALRGELFAGRAASAPSAPRVAPAPTPRPAAPQPVQAAVQPPPAPSIVGTTQPTRPTPTGPAGPAPASSPGSSGGSAGGGGQSAGGAQSPRPDEPGPRSFA